MIQTFQAPTTSPPWPITGSWSCNYAALLEFNWFQILFARDNNWNDDLTKDLESAFESQVYVFFATVCVSSITVQI
jgi:hypothetical protein